MTRKVNPSQNRKADAFKTAGAIAYGGHGDSGIVGDPNNPTEIATQDDDIDETAFDGFSASTSSSSTDVTIGPGEAFVFGSWLAKDTSTTVPLDGTTNNQTVYVGWDKDATNTVIIGTNTDFNNNAQNSDSRIAIWEFDTDASGVTSSTDKRADTLGFKRVDTVFGRDGDVTAQDNDYDHSQLDNITSNDHHDQYKDSDAESTVEANVEPTALNFANASNGDYITQKSGTPQYANFDSDAQDAVTGSVDAADLTGASGQNNYVLSTDGTNASWTNLDTIATDAPVDSVFGRTGTVTAQDNDYTHSQIDNVNPTDHHTRPTAGDGLADNSNTFDINVSDFAGTLLSDDGSDNLQVNEGSISHDAIDQNTVGRSDHHTKYTDSNAQSAVEGSVNVEDLSTSGSSGTIPISQGGSSLSMKTLDGGLIDSVVPLQAVNTEEPSTSSGSNQLAIGVAGSTSAETDESIVIGNNARAYDSLGGTGAAGAIAIGKNAEIDAPNFSGVAIGTDSTIGAGGVVAIGDNTTASGPENITIGKDVDTSNSDGGGVTIGSEIENTGPSVIIDHAATASGKRTVSATGATAINTGDPDGLLGSMGDRAIAIGQDCYADGNNAIAIGNFASAISDESIAIGGGNPTAKGDDAITIGSTEIDGGTGSIALGNDDNRLTTNNIMVVGLNSFRVFELDESGNLKIAGSLTENASL